MEIFGAAMEMFGAAMDIVGESPKIAAKSLEIFDGRDTSVEIKSWKIGKSR